MQTAEIKLEIFRYIDTLDTSKLSKFYNILFSDKKKTETDFWNTLTSWQKEDIELGIAELDNGKGTNFDEYMLKHK